jgi:hypothetical protein
MVWSLPEVVWVVYTFTVVMLCWLLLWSFGVAGIVALSIDVNGRWWLLVVSWQVLNFFFFVFSVCKWQTVMIYLLMSPVGAIWLSLN